jgi:hypothetical protein
LSDLDDFTDHTRELAEMLGLGARLTVADAHFATTGVTPIGGTPMWLCSCKTFGGGRTGQTHMAHLDDMMVAAGVPTFGPVVPTKMVQVHGQCDLFEMHDKHIFDIGPCLQECPGQHVECRNCDDRQCMSCVMREDHRDCVSDCPSRRTSQA